jgi:hypothetical protein
MYGVVSHTGVTDMGGFAATSVYERVWRRIERRGDDECWPWVGAHTLAGYGLIQYGSMYDRHSMAAHRAAYVSVKGSIPEGLVVMHSCDNPACCNPAHLSVGTHKENAADCAAKGRRRKTKTFGGRVRKLSDDDVRSIRVMGDGGVDKHEISAIFDICPTYVDKIIKRRAKAHVE